MGAEEARDLRREDARQDGDEAAPAPAADGAVGFTPGPWKLMERPFDGSLYIASGDPLRGRYVAFNIECEKPDGHLIAAAPGLFAALKDCADDLEAFVEDLYAKTKGYPGEARRYARDIAPVNAARAAIAKALGATAASPQNTGDE